LIWAAFGVSLVIQAKWPLTIGQWKGFRILKKPIESEKEHVLALLDAFLAKSKMQAILE